MTDQVNIYFGKVIDIKDPDDMLHRVKVAVDGYTDKLASEDLIWFFPFYGVNYLPEVGDEVSVIIFDDDFATGFYGQRVNVVSRSLDAADYESYLEIYKRKVDDKDVQLTYTKSKGIEFINGTTKQILELDKISLFVESNQIIMTKDRIDLGSGGEPAPLGDKTKKALEDVVAYIDSVVDEYNKLFLKLQASCSSGPVAPVGAGISSSMPAIIAKHPQTSQKLKQSLSELLSEKTFIE